MILIAIVQLELLTRSLTDKHSQRSEAICPELYGNQEAAAISTEIHRCCYHSNLYALKLDAVPT